MLGPFTEHRTELLLEQRERKGEGPGRNARGDKYPGSDLPGQRLSLGSSERSLFCSAEMPPACTVHQLPHWQRGPLGWAFSSYCGFHSSGLLGDRCGPGPGVLGSRNEASQVVSLQRCCHPESVAPVNSCSSHHSHVKWGLGDPSSPRPQMRTLVIYRRSQFKW